MGRQERCVPCVGAWGAHALADIVIAVACATVHGTVCNHVWLGSGGNQRPVCGRLDVQPCGALRLTDFGHSACALVCSCCACTGPQANSFTSAFMTQVPGMPTKVWSLLAGPDGTFVAGCSSGIVAVFDGAGSVVKQLKGHTHNVTSLAWMADPNLLASGAWGGEARVWNMTSGEAVKVMGEHENSVCVCPLPNGDLVTGSTGRQKEAGGLPTEFRLRLWRAGEEVSMVEDHTGAVRDVCALPAVGFASVSNDGYVTLVVGECVCVLSPCSLWPLRTRVHTPPARCVFGTRT